MGGSAAPTNTTSTVTQSNLPEYAAPYYQEILTRASQESNRPYERFEGQRTAEFSPDQQTTQQATMALQAPGQIGFGSNLAAAGGLGALQAGQYQPGQFSSQQVGQPNLQQYSMGAPQQVQGGQYDSPMMATAQTGYQPNLQQYEMGGARDVAGMGVNAPMMQAAQTGYGQGPLEQFRTEAPEAFGLEQAQQYMSPYAESVMEPQKREAIRSAKQGQLVQDLGAARQGTYGGSRQLLAGMERERNLGQQLGDIDVKGRQAAYENAQQQFERDRTAGMTAGQQNLQAALQQQQLGVNTGLQAALANLSSQQQANVNNQSTEFQARGMSADNAMKAALANQGVDVTRGQQNLQAQLQTQQLGAQTGVQTALANLSAEQQANVNNQAAQLQTQGLNAEQAMKAALANQQANITVGQQNLQSRLGVQELGAKTGLAALQANQQADLDRQRMMEQSRQFGGTQGLAGTAQAIDASRALGTLGVQQQNADMARLSAQAGVGEQQRQREQAYLDEQYADFLRQRDYPMERLGQYSNLLRGIPVGLNSTATTYAQAPSALSQVAGAGLGAASIYKMAT